MTIIVYVNSDQYNCKEYDFFEDIRDDPVCVTCISVYGEKIMTNIPGNALARFVNLQIFRCTNNLNLKELPPELFAQCPVLRKFYCSYNPKLSGLPNELFAKCPDLQYFYCSDNPSLSGLPDKLLANCPGLQYFYCSYNPELSGLPGELFAKCPGLQKFYCSNNPELNKLPDELFAKCPGLREFYCYNNPELGGLPGKLFAECPDLRTFYCSHNPKLSWLPEELFAKCPGLQTFVCSSNLELSGLLDELFANNRNLLEFWCQDNPKLKRLPASLLGCARLQIINIQDTPLENNTPQLIRFVHQIQNRQNHSQQATVYRDSQNVHNAAVHESARLSISRIIAEFHTTFTTQELFEQQIFGNPHLSKKSIDIVTDFLKPENDHVHSSLLIKFSELLNAVLNFISSQTPETQKTIFCILDHELNESDCVCYSGRLLRLINAINGFTPLVQISISEAQQIAYIALLSRELHPTSTGKQREYFIEEMRHRNYPDDVIQVWLEGFEADEEAEKQ